MSETPKTSAQIKLPPDLLAVTLVREGVNKHRARDIECWMNEKMTQAVEQATAELRAECDALRSDAERWKFVLRHSWKDLQRVRVLAGIKTDSVLGPNWQDAVDDLLEAAGTAEQAIAALAALKEPK